MKFVLFFILSTLTVLAYTAPQAQQPPPQGQKEDSEEVRAQADSTADADDDSQANASSDAGTGSIAKSGSKADNKGLANAAARAFGNSSSNALSKADGLARRKPKNSPVPQQVPAQPNPQSVTI